jgi:hypothetical protein
MKISRYEIMAWTCMVTACAGPVGAAVLLPTTESAPFIGALTVAGVGRLGMALMIVRRRKTAIMRRLMSR